MKMRPNTEGVKLDFLHEVKPGKWKRSGRNVKAKYK